MGKIFGAEPPNTPVELDIRKASTANGDLDGGSKLAGTEITGRITDKKLEFEHPFGTGFKKKFRGKHFLDIPDASGQSRLVAIGLFRKEAVPGASKKAGSKAAANGQEDGIWIVVKP
jgi:hypothetical protein